MFIIYDSSTGLVEKICKNEDEYDQYMAVRAAER